MGWGISLMKGCFGLILLAMVCKPDQERWRGKQERNLMEREPGAGRGGGRGYGEKVRHRQGRNSQLLLEADSGGRL